VAPWSFGNRSRVPVNRRDLRRRVRPGAQVTPLLKRLEQAGLIRRTRDAADERRVLLELTDDGLAMRDRVAAVPFRLVERMGIDAETGIRLKRDLEALLAALG